MNVTSFESWMRACLFAADVLYDDSMRSWEQVALGCEVAMMLREIDRHLDDRREIAADLLRLDEIDGPAARGLVAFLRSEDTRHEQNIAALDARRERLCAVYPWLRHVVAPPGHIYACTT